MSSKFMKSAAIVLLGVTSVLLRAVSSPFRGSPLKRCQEIALEDGSITTAAYFELVGGRTVDQAMSKFSTADREVLEELAKDQQGLALVFRALNEIKTFSISHLTN